MSPTNWLQGLARDAALAVRGWRRAPAYATIVILTFALGIGANVAVFTVLDAALFRQPPFENPDRLLQVFESDQRQNRRYGRVTVADLNTWRAEATLFDGIAGISQGSVTLQADDAAIQLSAATVSADFFRVLRVRVVLGRDFNDADAVTGAAPVAIVSREAADRLLGGDAVGRRVRLNDQPTEIIGVLPAGMPNPIGSSVDIWRPGDFGAVARDAQRAQRFHFLMAVARVRDDAPLEAARGQLRAIGERLGREFPQHNEGHLPNPVPLQYDDTEAVRGGLLLLMGAVACVLLIACANVANITLARGLSRIREFSVRAALGSSRRLLVRQMLVEQFCLATAGAAVGMLGAYWTLSALTGLERFGVPHTDQIRMDGRVLGFALILVLSATLLSALIPAFLTFRRDMFENLRTGGQGATLTRGGHRMRGALVVSQVGAATVLLFACALAIRSLGALLTVDTGFEAQAVWRFSATTPSTRYADADQIQAFQQQMLGRLRAIPGVVNASAAYAPPMENVSTTSVVLEGSVEPSPEIGYNAADGDYFQTLGIPLLAGRLMNTGDVNSGPTVAVVNRTMAERLWPGRSAIGQRVRTSTDANAEVVEVIGVVGDIRRQRIEEPPVAEMYYALTQDITRSPVYLVRLAPGVRPPLETIRSIVRELDPAIAVTGIAPLSATLEARSLARPGFIARLLGAFGGIALLLATIGTWGVIAALVAERRREIGIRKALGARDALIGRDVVGRGMAPVIGGVVLGSIGAIAAGRAIASGFYGVSAQDPVALVSVVTVLLLAGIAGCLGPARKAARLEPNLLMRESEVSG